MSSNSRKKTTTDEFPSRKQRSLNPVRLHIVARDAQRKGAGLLSEMLLHRGRRVPLHTQVHAEIRRGMKRDTFLLGGEIRMLTGQLLEAAQHEDREDYWNRIELLVGTPGAQFIIDEFSANAFSIFQGISDFLQNQPRKSIALSPMWEKIVSFSILRTHAAYIAARHAHDTLGGVDEQAEDQTRAGAKTLQLLSESLCWEKKSPGLARIETCLTRVAPVSTMQYRGMIERRQQH